MTTYQAEVHDSTGNVGVSVMVTKTMEEAIRWLAVTLEEPWAGRWTLEGPDVSLSGDPHVGS